MDTTGNKTYQVKKLSFRQQLHVDDNTELANFLGGTKTKKLRNYDVFVTELCEGNLKKPNIFTLTQSKNICKQLIEGLQQLDQSGQCHNDLKPENILYKYADETYENGDPKIVIRIADFGTAGRSGGTPGWTWPKFLSEREHGRSDMYSIGLMILYVMCESRELFYRLRDNYIEPEETWLTKIRSEQPIINLVIKMMTLELTVEEVMQKWDEISDSVDFLTKTFVQHDYEIPSWSSCLIVQDNIDKCTKNMANATLLDK